MTKDSAYFPALDGLRTVCCCWVIIGHGFLGHPLASYFKGLSHSGVHIFFALSGFLITSMMLREIDANDIFDANNFYFRRSLRIFPVYFLAIFIAFFLLLCFGDLYATAFRSSISQINIPQLFAAFSLFVGNFYHGSTPTTLEILWSISVEEQFYLVFGALMAGARSSSRVVWFAAIALVVAFQVRIQIASYSVDPAQAIYRNSFANADHLLLGLLLAYSWHKHPGIRAIFVKNAAAIQTLALIWILAISEWRPTSISGLVAFTPISAIGCALLVGSLAAGKGFLAKILEHHRMRQLGRFTYSGYVFHLYPLAISWWLARKLSADHSIIAPIRVILAIPGTFLIGFLMNRFIEAPLAKIGRGKIASEVSQGK